MRKADGRRLLKIVREQVVVVLRQEVCIILPHLFRIFKQVCIRLVRQRMRGLLLLLCKLVCKNGRAEPQQADHQHQPFGKPRRCPCYEQAREHAYEHKGGQQHGHGHALYIPPQRFGLFLLGLRRSHPVEQVFFRDKQPVQRAQNRIECVYGGVGQKNQFRQRRPEHGEHRRHRAGVITDIAF